MAFEGLGPAQQEQVGCIVVGVVCLWSVCRFYILYVWVCGMKDTGIPFTSCQPLYITSVNRCKYYLEYDTVWNSYDNFNTMSGFGLYSKSLGGLVLINYNHLMVPVSSESSNYVSTQVA